MPAWYYLCLWIWKPPKQWFFQVLLHVRLLVKPLNFKLSFWNWIFNSKSWNDSIQCRNIFQRYLQVKINFLTFNRFLTNKEKFRQRRKYTLWRSFNNLQSFYQPSPSLSRMGSPTWTVTLFHGDWKGKVWITGFLQFLIFLFFIFLSCDRWCCCLLCLSL